MKAGARWAFVWAALSASLALTGIFDIPRLPPSADMILPRRAGFQLFSAAMRHQRGLSTFCLALLWLSAFLLAAALWSRRKEVRAAAAGLRVWRGALGGLWLIGLVAIGRFDVSCFLDLAQNVWFMPESMDLREPLLTWSFLFAAVILFLRSAAAVLEWAAAKPAKGLARRTAVWTALLLGLGLWGKAWGVRGYDAGKRSLSEAAGITAGPRLSRAFVVLTEKDGAPDHEVHQLELGVPGQSEFSPQSLGAVASYVLERPGVFRLAGLRYLYGGCTMELDAAGLRAALAGGHRLGDPAASVLLLESLAWAPPNDQAARYLELLSNEDEYRVGPLAAAQLAVAYDHLGVIKKADYWRERSGIPEGLLASRRPGGALKPGLIRGQIRGARRLVRVGLYVHRDAQAPYALGPAQLVDAVTADSSGRFAFKGLAAGNYFLAFYLDFDRGGAPESIHVRGHRGDIHLSKNHPKADLPALELQF